MNDVLKAEFYYLFKNIRYYVFVGIVLAGNILSVLIQNPEIKQIINAVMSIVSFVFVAILLLEFTHKDFVNKTMKNYVGTGVNLKKVYFVKLIVCLSAVFVIMLISAAFREVSNASTTATGYNFNVIVFILNLLLNLFQASVVFFICSLIRSGAFAVIVSLVYYIILPPAIGVIINMIENDVVKNIVNQIQENLSSTLMNRLSNISLNGMEITQNIPIVSPELIVHFVVCTVVVVAITILGSYLYSLREVK